MATSAQEDPKKNSQPQLVKLDYAFKLVIIFSYFVSVIGILIDCFSFGVILNSISMGVD